MAYGIDRRSEGKGTKTERAKRARHERKRRDTLGLCQRCGREPVRGVRFCETCGPIRKVQAYAGGMRQLYRKHRREFDELLRELRWEESRRARLRGAK